LRFGRLNVVDPSPTPYVVPVTAKSPAYVVLETAVPSHRRYPVGAEFVVHMRTAPVGFPPKSPPTTLFLQSVIDVIVDAHETTTARRVCDPFQAEVEVCITPAEFIMM